MGLEKAFDRVPREVIRWAVRKLGVEQWLVSAVMSVYWCKKSRNKNGVSGSFTFHKSKLHIIYIN